MKDVHFAACEALRDELGREPTDAEIQAEYEDRLGAIYDQAMERRKQALEEGR